MKRRACHHRPPLRPTAGAMIVLLHAIVSESKLELLSPRRHGQRDTGIEWKGEDACGERRKDVCRLEHVAAPAGFRDLHRDPPLSISTQQEEHLLDLCSKLTLSPSVGLGHRRPAPLRSTGPPLCFLRSTGRSRPLHLGMFALPLSTTSALTSTTSMSAAFALPSPLPSPQHEDEQRRWRWLEGRLM